MKKFMSAVFLLAFAIFYVFADGANGEVRRVVTAISIAFAFAIFSSVYYILIAAGGKDI